MLLSRLINAPLHIRKIVAVTILLGMCAFFLAIAALGFDIVREKQVQLLELRERAGRLSQIVAMKDSVKQLVKNAPDLENQSLFVEAESITIGRARLQSRIEAIAQSHGLVIASAGSTPDIDEDSLNLIGMRVDLSGTHDALHKAIVDIETSKPPLDIRELEVRLTSGEAGDRPVELAVQIKIFGAFRKVHASVVDEAPQREVTP